jgi:hypothetical protein
MGVLSKVGNKLAYTDKESGEIIAEFRKNWSEDKLHVIMKQWDAKAAESLTTQETIEESEEA